MKVLIISPGKTHDDTVTEGIAEYQKRLNKKLDLDWNFPTVGSKESEAESIVKQIKDGDVVVLLDERGKDINTHAFAKLLDSHLQQGTKRMVFIIGGAFGVNNEVANMASETLKLSSLVFPHMLARLILVEQLYRAQSILEGGKYHH